MDGGRPASAGGAAGGAGRPHASGGTVDRGGRGGSRGGGRGGARGGRGGKTPAYEPKPKVTTTKREEAEIKVLEKRIAEESPAAGSMDAVAAEFTELPLSRYTLAGLNKAKFRTMTQIQRVAIPHALAGRDILGAAKTGSGKTLAFVVPVLERLFRQRWSVEDGCGALIVSPTRELALQIFEVVRAVAGTHFGLTAGVVCGGSAFEEEKEAIGRLCVVVATPGRLLQHLEQSPDFSVANLASLVLDEADRLLDMGFADTLNAILGYLPGPPQRQTMLFSATQTKSVRDLARLSLVEPQYLAVHEAAAAATPARLQQTYVLCGLADKLNLLFSFIRTHLTAKTIVFLSSCKQSRFVFEAFRRLRPGVPLQLLHGKMKQARRQLVYYDFLKKPACVLFATDIAARGLDFPSVDWVLQLDCPEDVPAYIHRVGRTARFRAKGAAMLVLLPSEAKGFLPKLADAKIPIAQVKVNPATAVSVTGKIAAEVAADAELKSLAQKAFASYARSVLLQPAKDVFSVAALPLQAYAESLGLAVAPKVKIGARAGAAEDTDALRAAAHARKNENRSLAALRAQVEAEAAKGEGGSDDDSDGEDDSDSDGKGKGKAKARRHRELADESDSGDDDGSDDDDGEDDSDSDGSSDDGAAAARSSKRRKAAAASDSDDDDESSGSSGSDSDDIDDDDSDDDAILVPKTKGRAIDAIDAADLDTERAAAAGAKTAGRGGSGKGAIDEVPREVLARMSDKERARLFAIQRDTALLGQGGAKKGTDGLTPFQRIAAAASAAKGTAAAAGGAGAAAATVAQVTAAASANASRVAAKLALNAAADREHEKERIRGKHREERLRAKGIDPDARSDVDEEEEDEAAFAGDKRFDGDSDDDEGSGKDGSSGGSSDGSSDDDSDSDDEEAAAAEEAAKRRRAMTMVAPVAAAAAAKPAAPAAAAASAAARGKPAATADGEPAALTGGKRRAPLPPAAAAAPSKGRR